MQDRTVDRHEARQQRVPYVGSCAWCGDLVLHSADLPGRRPRFCSPKCRLASYRAAKRTSLGSTQP
jgi:hypothetical protein